MGPTGASGTCIGMICYWTGTEAVDCMGWNRCITAQISSYHVYTCYKQPTMSYNTSTWDLLVLQGHVWVHGGMIWHWTEWTAWVETDVSLQQSLCIMSTHAVNNQPCSTTLVHVLWTCKEKVNSSFGVNFSLIIQKQWTEWVATDVWLQQSLPIMSTHTVNNQPYWYMGPTWHVWLHGGMIW